MPRATLGLLLAAAFAACERPRPAADVAAIRHVIDSLNTKLEEWYRTGQTDSIASAFAADVWQMPPNSQPLVGRDSIRSYWANMFQAGRVEFDLETMDVVAVDSIAVERGQYSVTFTPAPGAPIPAFADRGNYVVLWRRESDGHWRAVWDAPVSVLPPPATSGGTSAPGT